MPNLIISVKYLSMRSEVARVLIHDYLRVTFHSTTKKKSFKPILNGLTNPKYSINMSIQNQLIIDLYIFELRMSINTIFFESLKVSLLSRLKMLYFL